MFVGREDDVERLKNVLTGAQTNGRLTIQTIVGSGGIGKTTFLDHVLYTYKSELQKRNYLVLRVQGSETYLKQNTPFLSLLKDLIAGSRDFNGKMKSMQRFFVSVFAVLEGIERLQQDSVREVIRKYPDNKELSTLIPKLIDASTSIGVAMNKIIPATKNYVNPEELQKHKQLITNGILNINALVVASPTVWNVFTKWTVKRDRIKSDPLEAIADAFSSDLRNILAKHRTKSKSNLTIAKEKDVDRLLIILDDYEFIGDILQNFLLDKLLPKLADADFDTVILICGRDKLENTNSSWEQHFKSFINKRIALSPLSKNEMNELATDKGIISSNEQQSIWDDTRGYPFMIDLWLEERAEGGSSATSVNRFYQRTTRWMSDQQKGWLNKVIFVNEVNKTTLRLLFNSEDEVSDVMNWFKDEGSVRDDSSESYRVRPYLQSRLKTWVRNDDPDEYIRLETVLGEMSGKAYDYQNHKRRRD